MEDVPAVGAQGAGANDFARRGLREVGHLACWSVTSAKPGNGVELLRDGRTDTYWQSDGSQPHVISLQFNRRMALVVSCKGPMAILQEVHLYVDCKLDESYTPSKLSVQVGSCVNDLTEVKVVDLEEPTGWVVIPLDPSSAPYPLEQQAAQLDAPPHVLPAFLLQLAVLTNHQNGRDTHVRGVRVFGQLGDPVQDLLRTPLAVATPEFRMYTWVR